MMVWLVVGDWSLGIRIEVADCRKGGVKENMSRGERGELVSSLPGRP